VDWAKFIATKPHDILLVIIGEIGGRLLTFERKSLTPSGLLQLDEPLKALGASADCKEGSSVLRRPASPGEPCLWRRASELPRPSEHVGRNGKRPGETNKERQRLWMSGLREIAWIQSN
jgi:hypothetical protein